MVIVTGDVPELEEEHAEDLKAKFDTLLNQGMEVAKIAKAFSLKEIQVVAGQYDIEAEEDDSVEDVVQAIVNQIEGVNTKEEE